MGWSSNVSVFVGHLCPPYKSGPRLLTPILPDKRYHTHPNPLVGIVLIEAVSGTDVPRPQDPSPVYYPRPGTPSPSPDPYLWGVRGGGRG